MPIKYWDEAFRTMGFLINRLPTPTLDGKSTIQVLFNIPPDYSILRVFGCACYTNTRPFNSHKLNFHSIPSTFLGYNLNHEGYKCLDPNGKIIISKDVIFDKLAFPFTCKTK